MSDRNMAVTNPCVQNACGEHNVNTAGDIAAPVVTPFTVTRYRCPTCRKTGSSRAQMQAHADTCIHNLDTKSCATCAFNVLRRLEVAGGYKLEYACSKGAREAGKTLNLNCPSWQPKTEEV